MTTRLARRPDRAGDGGVLAGAARDGELVGELWVAIDVTKGTPFTGEMDTDADRTVVEPYILGHRDENDTIEEMKRNGETV